MKILLTAINAKYIHSNLAVYALKAAAGEYSPQVAIAEYTINNSPEDVLSEVYKQKPDVLMFSCYIWNIAMVEEVSREFHKLCPTVPIWVGGPEVSYEVEDFLEKHPQIQGIMMGEGEETLHRLCQYYVLGELEEVLRSIKGIAYRSTQSEEIMVNEWRPVSDMSGLPFAYNRMEDFSNRIIYYESSRGCPFSCSYCLSSIDKQLRFRDIELVKEELLFFMEQKVPQIKFVDRTFNCRHDHAMAIWQFIKDHDNGITNFHFEISADLLREEELELISTMRPGLIQLEIGVQSTNEATILEIHRTMRLESVKEVVRRIKSFGNIHQHLDLIAGLPYENYDCFGRSFDEIYALKPNQLQMGFLKVLKGSYMYEHKEEYGILYHDMPPYEVMATHWLSYDDVLRMKRVEEMLEVYYNSGQFEVTMQVLEHRFAGPFEMYQKLGDFYESCGLFAMSHSRIRRAEILMDFLRQEWQASDSYEADMECIRQALVFDIYYRENSKSRPEWAGDSGAFKNITHYYCKNGKLSHVEPFDYDFLRHRSGFPERETERVWVLFSYDRRDPLSHQAKVEYVYPKQDMQE